VPGEKKEKGKDRSFVAPPLSGTRNISKASACGKKKISAEPAGLRDSQSAGDAKNQGSGVKRGEKGGERGSEVRRQKKKGFAGRLETARGKGVDPVQGKGGGAILMLVRTGKRER